MLPEPSIRQDGADREQHSDRIQPEGRHVEDHHARGGLNAA
jgi:hypothetical protein